ncbi:MAG: energy transducer TonB [Planctomycetes bacterium]|nr:energy transducer TonB [Planctomycetota bacterium]
MIVEAELRKPEVRLAARRRAPAQPRRVFSLSAWGAAFVAHAALLALAATLTAAVNRHTPRGPELAPIRLELGGTGPAGFSAPSGREAVASRLPDAPDLPAGEIETSALPALADPSSLLDGAPAGLERASQEDLMAGYLPGTRVHGRPGDGRGVRPGSGESGGAKTGETNAAPGGGGPVAAAGGGSDAAPAGNGGGGGDGWARRRGGRLPQYPVAARRRGLEGTVTLALDVARDGAVLEVHVEESSGYRLLDDEAVEAAKSWTFEPAIRDGGAVATHVSMPVTFRLTD